jgi:hypothetical protein
MRPLSALENSLLDGIVATQVVELALNPVKPVK